MSVRVRFAPSPTGYLHIGGARTALFCWLYARKQGGTFILRIEDTDRERSTEESINAILDSMAWLKLGYDEGPFYQTQRMDRYHAVIEQMLAAGTAYYCYCTVEEVEQVRQAQLARREKPRYNGCCRLLNHGPRAGAAVRFKNPLEGTVVVDDLTHGKVVFQNQELDDLVLARGDGFPTYNFTVVVDDMDMQITHVIRGDDHLNNTPRQMNILKAIGAALPQYAHVPMILGSDGKRLSKRHGAVSVLQYQEEGYLPEALLNYLVRLGWSHGDQEIFSREEMVQYFELTAVHKSASIFNPEKLLWLNQQYIQSTPPVQLAKHLRLHFERLQIDTSQGPDLVEVIKAMQTRAKTLVELAQGCKPFYHEPVAYDHKAVVAHLNDAGRQALRVLKLALLQCDSWEKEVLHGVLKATADGLHFKMGQIAQPLRIALTGGTVSPPIDLTAQLLGKTNTLLRIDKLLREF